VLGKRRLKDVVARMLRADWKSYTTASAFALRSSHFFKPLAATHSYESLDPDIPISALRTVAASLLLVPDQMWNADVHRENIVAIVPPSSEGALSDGPGDKFKAWKKEVYHFLRWSLVGGASGPPLPDLMEIMGRNICVQRISDAIQKTLAQEQASPLKMDRPQVLALAAEA
jgi:glutamyl-tRNA synthetase